MVCPRGFVSLALFAKAGSALPFELEKRAASLGVRFPSDGNAAWISVHAAEVHDETEGSVDGEYSAVEHPRDGVFHPTVHDSHCGGVEDDSDAQDEHDGNAEFAKDRTGNTLEPRAEGELRGALGEVERLGLDVHARGVHLLSST